MGFSRWVAEIDVLNKVVGKNYPLCSFIIFFQNGQAALFVNIIVHIFIEKNIGPTTNTVQTH